MTVPVAKILKYFPPMPATCTPGSPGPPEAVSCGPRECGSHLQLPLESGHLATQGRHLGAVRGCRPALQRLFKTDDLLGELRDLQRGGGVSSRAGPTRGAAVRAAGQARDNNGHILAAGELRPAGRPRCVHFHTGRAGVRGQKRNAISRYAEGRRESRFTHGPSASTLPPARAATAAPSRARCLSGPECAARGTRPLGVTRKGTSRGQKGRKPGGQPWVWVPVDPFLKGKMI